MQTSCLCLSNFCKKVNSFMAAEVWCSGHTSCCMVAYPFTKAGVMYRNRYWGSVLAFSGMQLAVSNKQQRIDTCAAIWISSSHQISRKKCIIRVDRPAWSAALYFIDDVWDSIWRVIPSHTIPPRFIPSPKTALMNALDQFPYEIIDIFIPSKKSR